jgi:hypothetical protein
MWQGPMTCASLRVHLTCQAVILTSPPVQQLLPQTFHRSVSPTWFPACHQQQAFQLSSSALDVITFGGRQATSTNAAGVRVARCCVIPAERECPLPRHACRA